MVILLKSQEKITKLVYHNFISLLSYFLSSKSPQIYLLTLGPKVWNSWTKALSKAQKLD